MPYFTGVMRKIGDFIWYQKLHFDGWIQKWSGHTPLTGVYMYVFPISIAAIKENIVSKAYEERIYN